MDLGSSLPLWIILASFFPALIVFALPEEQSRLRNSLNIFASTLTLVLVGLAFYQVMVRGETLQVALTMLPNLEIVLRIDPVSLLFAVLSASMWWVTTLYSIGYMADAQHKSRFFGFFTLSITAALGVAFSGNLLTFLVCFELLTLFTFPLVIHEGTLEASKGARTYLIYTLGGGIVLLTGVVWLYGLAGPIDFSVKGVLQALPVTTHPQLIAIFVLLIVGVGVKAALFPLHGWLPEAMVAPAPVSALLHAVAVVKAGAFGVIRVVHHVYGEGFADSLGVLTPLAVLAGITIIVGSLRALTQNDLKRRLAYSTVSQVSYIVLGVSLAGMIAPVGGMVHLIHQGLMKITLFFCAGIFAQSLHIKSVSDMNGIGQKMPLTMLAFTVGALGMMGVPPVAGFVSKWYLGLGAASVGHYWAIALLMASAALNAGYFLPILYRAWFLEADDDGDLVLGASEWVLSKRTMLIPVLITALLSVLAGLFAMSDWSPLALVQAIVSQEYLP